MLIVVFIILGIILIILATQTKNKKGQKYSLKELLNLFIVPQGDIRSNVPFLPWDNAHIIFVAGILMIIFPLALLFAVEILWN